MSGVITATVREVARLKCNAKGCTARWQSKPFTPGGTAAYDACIDAFAKKWCIAMNSKARPVTFCPQHASIAVARDMRMLSGPVGHESKEAWLERRRREIEAELEREDAD